MRPSVEPSIRSAFVENCTARPMDRKLCIGDEEDEEEEAAGGREGDCPSTGRIGAGLPG